MSDTYRDLIAEIHRATCAAVPNEMPQAATRSHLTLLMDANAALRVLSDPALRDFPEYLHRQTVTKLARAELNAASVKGDLCLMRERCAEVMSQGEPLASIGLDRELVRQVLQYVQTGRLK